MNLNDTVTILYKKTLGSDNFIFTNKDPCVNSMVYSLGAYR